MSLTVVPTKQVSAVMSLTVVPTKQVPAVMSLTVVPTKQVPAVNHLGSCLAGLPLALWHQRIMVHSLMGTPTCLQEIPEEE